MLIQIAPELPPIISGVGHYASCLARSLRDGYGIDSELAEPSRLLDVGADVVLLHYSGYGFARRGCPFRLVRLLEEWKSKKDERQLVTIFHELTASGKPWQSAFWLRPVQGSLIRRVARLSNAALTSREANRRELSALGVSERLKVDVLPIFSNVGEPRSFIAHRERENTMVVFGTAGRRAEVYRYGFELINEIATRLGLTKILDIGPDCGPAPDVIGGAAVERRGELDAEEIHALLSRAKLGLLDYPANILAKSGIFAAYAAHGLAPVVLSRRELGGEDGLLQGEHYFVNAAPHSQEEAEAAGENAYGWYSAHGTRAHAQWVAASVHGRSHG